MYTAAEEALPVSVAVTGQIVVEMATVAVTITVLWLSAGQFVTEAAHEVMVDSVVV